MKESGSKHLRREGQEGRRREEVKRREGGREEKPHLLIAHLQERELIVPTNTLCQC